MFTDDNGIVRFETSDEITPLHTALNTALGSVSDAIEDVLGSSEWQPITLTDTTNFSIPDASRTPEIRRLGSVVELRGIIRCIPANYVTGPNKRDWGVLPDSSTYPYTDLGVLAAIDNRDACWLLTITEQGVVQASNYTVSAVLGSQNQPADTDLVLNSIWVVD